MPVYTHIYKHTTDSKANEFPPPPHPLPQDCFLCTRGKCADKNRSYIQQFSSVLPIVSSVQDGTGQKILYVKVLHIALSGKFYFLFFNLYGISKNICVYLLQPQLRKM